MLLKAHSAATGGTLKSRTRSQMKNAPNGALLVNGGERGIRTLDTLLTYTRFPSVLLKPLGHLSVIWLWQVMRAAILGDARLAINEYLGASRERDCTGSSTMAK